VYRLILGAQLGKYLVISTSIFERSSVELNADDGILYKVCLVNEAFCSLYGFGSRFSLREICSIFFS